MSEKMFGTRVDDVDSTIINITRDGEDFAWFLSDIVTDKQVEKVVDKLNELSEEKEYFERKKEYFLSKWSIVNAKNIQLRQEIKELKKENEQLRRDKNFLRNERRLQEKAIFTSFDEINKLNKENENLKRDHRIMVEKLYIISKDYIKDVGKDNEC